MHLDYKKQPLLSLHFSRTSPLFVSARVLFLSLPFSGRQKEVRQSRSASARFLGLRRQNPPRPRAYPPIQPHPHTSVPGGEENRELKIVPELPRAPGVTFLQARVRPDCISEPPRGAVWK